MSRVAYISSATDPCSPFAHSASTTALLLLDFHTFTVNMINPPTTRSSVVTATNKLITWARENKVLVVHALIDVKGTTAETSKAKSRWAMHEKMLASDPELEAEFVEFRATRTAENEVTVTRRPGLISALKSDGLMDLLKERGITSLVMAGLSTSGCLLSTAKASCDEGFVTTVVKDGCSDTKPEVHEMLCADTGVLVSNAHVMGGEVWAGEWERLVKGGKGE